MRNKYKKYRLNKHGFTLIEVVLALALTAIAFLAIYALFASNIKHDTESRYEVIASNLAQEGIEIIRNRRDEEIMKGNHIHAFLPAVNCKPQFLFPAEWGQCRTDAGIKPEVCFDGTKYWNCLGNINDASPFSRTCDIISSDSDGDSTADTLTVTCTVSWTRFVNPNLPTKSVSATSILTDWYDPEIDDLKPVIYLYPTEKTNVQVQLFYDGDITADYPAYKESIKGWDVEAYPDGRIINKADNREYSYLFWEGKAKAPIKWNLKEGFVVKGEDTRVFLQQTLSQIGLTPKEYNEFIVYWYPLMKDNAYNLIHFANEQYTNRARLKIDPMPDSMLRVFMVYKPLRKKIEIHPQNIKPFERKGFTVVEWGGTNVE